MPKVEGKTQLSVQIPDELAEQISALTTSGDVTKQALVEHALRAQIEGTVLRDATDGFRQQLSSAHNKVECALDAMREQLTVLTHAVHSLDSRIRALEEYDHKRYGTLLEAFDRIKSASSKQARAGVLQMFQRKG
jgi:hypothetical protein